MASPQGGEDEIVVIQICPAKRTELMLSPIPRVQQTEPEPVSELTVRALFDTEEAALLRYAFSLSGRRAVAEEIVQEVFLQLHMRWEEVQSPRAWLFRSVRNRVYNHIRNNKREVLGSENDAEQTTDCDEDAPDSMLLRMEATGALRGLLEELEESDRELVQLKYFEGLKYREISERTGLSVGNVGYRLHHILKELARKLRPLGIEEIS